MLVTHANALGNELSFRMRLPEEDSSFFKEGEPTAFYREFFTNLWAGLKPEGMLFPLLLFRISLLVFLFSWS